MGNRLSPQRNVQGDFSSNSHSTTISNSGNIMNHHYYNYGDGNSPENWAEILQQLYPPGSGYESHRNRVRKPVEGTCTWVTGHPKYKKWLEDQKSGLLWLSADPGCGKSVIASFLVTHLNIHTAAIVCYFFFKDDSEEQRSATFALRAILHQLFGQRSTLCGYAREEFKKRGKRFTEEVDTLWNILTKAVAQGGCGEVICVIDALDECEEETLAPLIRHITCLRGSQSSDTPLKFLITSRPYHTIEKEFSSQATTIRLKGEYEIDAITTDVTRVIDNGINELELVWENPGGLEYLRDLLKSSADRTFLWVSLVLEILKDNEVGTREEFTNIVSTAPRDLAEFYTKILDKRANSEKARRILHVVLAAARPLTLREMNIALTVRRNHKSMKELHRDLYPTPEKTVRNLCGLFVRVIDTKIYLVHQTAREFLIKAASPGRGNWQHTLCPEDSNFILADICISYLSLEDFENDPLVADDSGVRKKEAVHNYFRRYDLLDYAASYWADHFRDSGDRHMELFECTRLICERGSGRFRTWLKVYWENSGQYHPFPNDFSHLMVACWLGQRKVVERLLKEGGDINARSKGYGTALHIAALQNDVILTRMLLQRGVEVYISGKGYNILNITGYEFARQISEQRRDEKESLERFFDFNLSEGLKQEVLKRHREIMERRGREDYVIEFLKPFCIPDKLDWDIPTSMGTSPLP